MTHRPTVPLAFPTAVSAVLIGGALAMTWYGLAIAADGSYFLVRVLGDEGVFGPGQRILADAARQAPVLAGATLGVTDTHVLTLLYGAGQLVVTAVVWSAAVFLSRRDPTVFIAVATTAGLCAGNTWLFSVSENVLAVPLTMLVAVILWEPGAWRWGHGVLAAAASLLLVASYETAVLTGAVLATWAAWRSRDARTRAERYGCRFVAASSAVSIAVAIAGASSGGPGPRHAQAFVYYLLSFAPWPFFVGLTGVVALVCALELRTRSSARRVLTGAGCAMLGLAVVAAETTFSAAYEARGGASAAALFGSLFLWWRWADDRRSTSRRARDAQPSAWLLGVPVVVAALLVTTNVAVSRNWSESLDVFRASVDAESGLLPAEDVLPEGRKDVLWDWTSSSLSLLVRGDPGGAILYDRNPSYVPFTPEKASEQLPDGYTWRS